MLEVVRLLSGPLFETIAMVIASTIIALVAGGMVGIGLFIMSNQSLSGHSPLLRYARNAADRIINVLRSFPFIILMVVVLPLSRLLVGTSIGTIAAIVPLSVAASPFIARIVESSLSEIDNGIIDAALACGAHKGRILFAILIPEALPALVSGLTLTMISLVGYSAMAGVIGGGGLGDLAIRYGYQRFRTDIMVAAVSTIIVLVEGLQALGTTIVKKLKGSR